MCKFLVLGPNSERVIVGKGSNWVSPAALELGILLSQYEKCPDIPILGLIFKLEVARQSSQSRPFCGFLDIGPPPSITQELAYRAEPVEPSSGKHSALNNERVGAGSIQLPKDEELQPEARERLGYCTMHFCFEQERS